MERNWNLHFGTPIRFARGKYKYQDALISSSPKSAPWIVKILCYQSNEVSLIRNYSAKFHAENSIQSCAIAFKKFDWHDLRKSRNWRPKPNHHQVPVLEGVSRWFTKICLERNVLSMRSGKIELQAWREFSIADEDRSERGVPAPIPQCSLQHDFIRPSNWAKTDFWDTEYFMWIRPSSWNNRWNGDTLVLQRWRNYMFRNLLKRSLPQFFGSVKGNHDWLSE